MYRVVVLKEALNLPKRPHGLLDDVSRLGSKRLLYLLLDLLNDRLLDQWESHLEFW